jgi:hypothetical protein
MVDSGSTDGSVESAQRYGARVVRIPPGSFNHGLARNLGAEEAKGEYLVFMTQDALPAGRFVLHRMVKTLLDHPDLGAVSARALPRSDADLFAAWQVWAHRGFLGVRGDEVRQLPSDEGEHRFRGNVLRGVAQLDNACCAIRRELFLRYRFSELPYAEDLELGIRLARDRHRIGFLDSAGVIHSHNRPPLYFLKRSYLEGKTVPRLLDEDVRSGLHGREGWEGMVACAGLLYRALGRLLSSKERKGGPHEVVGYVRKGLLSTEAVCSPSDGSAADTDGVLAPFWREAARAGPLFGRAPSSDDRSAILDLLIPCLDNFSVFLSGRESADEAFSYQLDDALYKIFAVSAGLALGRRFDAWNRSGTVDDPAIELDRWLSGGV